MDLLLIRHAEPAWFDQGSYSGPNPGLTERGLRQADRTAERMADAGITELWVSPMVRAQQTARPLAAATGLEIVTMDWLAEARPPSVDELSNESIFDLFNGSRRRSVEQWWSGLGDGEPLVDFVARIGGGLDRVLGERGAKRDDTVSPPIWRDVPQDGTICIVSHAGTSAAALSHLLGIEQVPWAWERFMPLHASVSLVRTVGISDGVIFSLRGFSAADHHPVEEQTA